MLNELRNAMADVAPVIVAQVEPHPLADIFPMMSPKDLAALADDVATRGLRDPTILHDGKILDGRNRYQACIRAGVEQRFEEFDGDDPLAFVVSSNLHRRHLTDDQRAVIAAKLANMKQGARTDLSPIGGRSQAAAADMLNVSKRKVERVAKVINDGAPELAAAVEQGEVSVSAAALVATMPVEKQKEIVSAGPRAVKAAAKKIREAPKKIDAERMAVAEKEKPKKAAKPTPDDLFAATVSALDAMSVTAAHRFSRMVSEHIRKRELGRSHCARRPVERRRITTSRIASDPRVEPHGSFSSGPAARPFQEDNEKRRHQRDLHSLRRRHQLEETNT